MQQILAISHYTFFEARRTRLLMLLGFALGAVFTLAFFVSELAVTESLRMQTTFYAAGARLAAVFIVATHVIGSVTREFNDKGLDVLLALDLPRSHYILGKLLGFLAIGVVIGVIACLPALWMAPPVATAQWGVALVLELAVVIAFSLFCVMAFGQFMPAAAVVLAFYVLARSLTAIRLMSAHPISGADAISHDIGRWMIEGLALITPALDQWPQTTWLIDAPASWSVVFVLLGEAALYVTLLTAAAMVDFHRRNF
jgi:ABC-type transport system involved in multi-copper enzyme maturation permease subunit